MKNAILAFILVLSVFAWQCAQWIECREAGLSAFYCIQHIS